jgi:flagellar biosynthesis protein FlhB
MSGNNDAGDKTEKPTAKKLQDARKKGDVAKSKDVTSAVGLVMWLVLGVLTVGYAGSRLATLYDSLFVTIGQGWLHAGFAGATERLLPVRRTGHHAGGSAADAGGGGRTADRLSAGRACAVVKPTPSSTRLNPVEGVRRMFSMDN